MHRVKKRRDNPVARLHSGTPEKRLRHEIGVSRLEMPVGPDVEVDPHVGEAEEGAGCEGDGPVLVVWVEARLGGLLPA